MRHPPRPRSCSLAIARLRRPRRQPARAAAATRRAPAVRRPRHAAPPRRRLARLAGHRRAPGATAATRAAAVAMFGPAARTRWLVLRCDRAKRRVLPVARRRAHGAADDPHHQRHARARRRSRPAAHRPMSRRRSTSADPLLDAMAFSRGRFVVEQPARGTLVLPGMGRNRARGGGLPRLTSRRQGARVCRNLRNTRLVSHVRAIQIGRGRRRPHRYQQAKGGDPMSHGSAVGSVQFVRGTRF